MRWLVGGILCVWAWHAWPADVELAGVIGSKAVLVIDGGAPVTLAVGEARNGVRLLELGGGVATIDVDGRRQRIALEAAPIRIAAGDSAGSRDSESGSGTVSLHSDSSGHHFASGSINGSSMRFLVDTGASMVSIGKGDARRAGIDFKKGRLGITQTATGPSRVWKVRLDTVRIGDVTLYGVDGLVHENELPFVLLGMSFLSRVEMQHEGSRLILRKRF